MSEGQREALLGTTPLPQEVLDMVIEYSYITTYDALRRVVESGHSGNYDFAPSLEEYERCMGEGRNFRKLLNRKGFAFHVTLPEGLQQVGERAFYWCSSLTSVTFPEGLREVGENAFYWCRRLTSVTFAEGLQRVGDQAFYWCSSLTSVTFPEGLREVGENAFYWCRRLTSVTFPEELQQVGGFAFSGCSSLTSVTFPEGLQQVGENAFYACSSLQTIKVPENIPLNRNYLGILPGVRIIRIRRAPDQGDGPANKKQRRKLRF